MANIKSQIKRNRQNERRRLRNKSVRSEVKTRVKVAVQAAESGAEDSAEAVRTAIKRIDKAAAQGVIHKNQAANKKSRLMRASPAAPPSYRREPAFLGPSLLRRATSTSSTNGSGHSTAPFSARSASASSVMARTIAS
jgi:small subunit ribosomal protein S20